MGYVLLTSIVDLATQERLSSLAHLGQDHGGDLLGSEGLGLALELDLDVGLATLLNDLEREVLHIGLDLGVLELAANETLGVEDRVVGVHGDLVLGRISDQTLSVGETNCEKVSKIVLDNEESKFRTKTRSSPVSLIVCNDLNLVVGVVCDASSCC